MKKNSKMREVEARREGWIVVTVRDCREKKNRIKGGTFRSKKGSWKSRGEGACRMEKYASVGEEEERIR